MGVLAMILVELRMIVPVQMNTITEQLATFPGQGETFLALVPRQALYTKDCHTQPKMPLPAPNHQNALLPANALAHRATE
jgi:hypothetical protein